MIAGTGASTVYDIKVKYEMDDKMSAALAGLGAKADAANKAAQRTRESFSLLAVAMGAAFVAPAAAKALIGYNAELEKSKQTISGLLMLNLGGTWERNFEEAGKMLEDLRERAKRSAGSLKDMVDFAASLTAPLASAGMGTKQIAEFTHLGVVAAKSFGVEANSASADIAEMVAGTLDKKDKFARRLLEPLYGPEATKIWNKFAAQGGEKLKAEFKKVFAQPALKAMQAQYEHSFDGVTSALKENAEATFGKMGKSLFEHIKKETKELNKWFDNNQAAIKQFSNDFGEGLKSGFSMMKEIAKFIIDNRGLLLTLAKAMLVSKGFQLLGGAGGLVGGLGSDFKTVFTKWGRQLDEAGKPLEGFTKNLTASANKLAGLPAVLGTIYFAADRFANWLDRRQGKAIDRNANVQGVKDWAKDLMSGKLYGRDRDQFAAELYSTAKDKGLYNKDGTVNQAAVYRAHGLHPAMAQMMESQVAAGIPGGMGMLGGLGADRASFDAAKQTMIALGEAAAVGIERAAVRALTNPGGLMWGFNAVTSFMQKDGEYGARAKGNKPKIEATVKIEVISDDPDRFSMQLMGVLQDLGKNPTGADAAFREG